MRVLVACEYERFRVVRLSASIWAVHDTTKPYGDRATFYTHEAAAARHAAEGQQQKGAL